MQNHVFMIIEKAAYIKNFSIFCTIMLLNHMCVLYKYSVSMLILYKIRTRDLKKKHCIIFITIWWPMC